MGNSAEKAERDRQKGQGERAGHADLDGQNGTSEMRQAEQGRQNRAGRTGHAKWDRQNRTGRQDPHLRGLWTIYTEDLFEHRF
jgi:hypothetical protein